jgi:hypothetical protein
MSDSKNLLAAIYNNDEEAVRSNFHDIMDRKTNDILDSRKPSIASKIFNNSDDEE